MSYELLRIANCSGFYGDRQTAAAELLSGGDIDVLTGDWLAELTMLILHRQWVRDPLRGFATTFIGQLEVVLGTCLERGIRIVSNAGGVNPEGCADAVRALAERLGLTLSVGKVSGDALTGNAPALLASGALLDAETGQPLQASSPPLSAHAYLGGWGIAGCLAAGADVVVTGRVTDAALVVGPAAWAFGWRADDWDALAGALVAGHVIECGGQATGGNFSFSSEIADMAHIGFPIAELYPDGSSVITKAAGSGGAVTVETVTAQLLYEVGAPNYLNPDVTARLDTAELSADGPNRVRIAGVRGESPPNHLKVSMAFEGGYRNAMSIVLTGLDIEAKAAMAEAALWPLIPRGRAAFAATSVELLGRPAADPADPGASVSLLRIAVAGPDRDLVGRDFSAAVIQSALCSVPGFFTTTPPTQATSYARYQPGLVAADLVTHNAAVDGRPVPVTTTPRTSARSDPRAPSARAMPTGHNVASPLGRVCGARSGDKGGNANIGVWVRRSDGFDWLAAFLTADRLRALLPGAQNLRIDRFEFENLGALNFVIHSWLGDGVASSLRFDAQAKGLGEYLRARVVDVPEYLVASASALGPAEEWV